MHHQNELWHASPPPVETQNFAFTPKSSLMLCWNQSSNPVHCPRQQLICIPLLKNNSSWFRMDNYIVWCWRRLLRVPQTARRSNQSILKKISPEYSSEGLMLKLKLQYFGHLRWRTDSLEKMLGKIEGRRRQGRQRVRWLDGMTDLMDMSLSKL